MFDLDHWQEIGAALTRNRLRTALTAFGVFWGIFLLVVMLGAGNGLANGVLAGFSNVATNSMFVWSMRTSKPYKGLEAGRTVQFTNEDTFAIVRHVPEAEVVTPRLQLGSSWNFQGAATVRRGLETGSFSVTGDSPEIFRIRPMELDRGRLLNRLDMKEKRKIAIIGTRVVETLFKRGEDPLDQSIEINGVQFKVVGLSKSRQTGDQAEREAQAIFIPFTTFQQAFNAGDKVHSFAVIARSDVRASVVEKKVVDLLRERHRVAPDDRRGVGSFNLEDEFGKIQGLFIGIQILMWVVGLGTLAAGAIGVSNIMLVVVRERTHELGLRRAIGATPAKVMMQIVSEAVVLTAGAGLLGLCAGVGVLELVAGGLAHASAAGPSMFRNPGVSFADALGAVAILVVAGTIAGLIPARRAVVVSPVVALRSE